MAYRSHQRSLRVILMILLTVVSGCAGAPVQEMSNARQAVSAARAAGAEKVAPDQLSEAQTLLLQAEKHLHKRQYREARRNAVEARVKAAEALQASQSKRAGNS